MTALDRILPEPALIEHQFLHGRAASIRDQHGGLVQHDFHAIGVRDEVRLPAGKRRSM